MSVNKDAQWRPYVVLLGGVIIHITLGTLFTFGNMTPYITSYIRQESQPRDLRYKDSNLTFAVLFVGMGVSMWFGGYLEKRLGARLAVLLGGWTMSLGVLLSYVTVKHSFALFCLTYGVLQGIGIGTAYAVPLICAMRWIPKRKGLVSGIIVSGFGGGSIIFNQVQTAFINPTNLKANVSLPNIPGETYFEEGTLLRRVPYSFLLCGGCYAVLQLLGCLMLLHLPEDTETDSKIALVKRSRDVHVGASDADSSDDDNDSHDRQHADEKTSGLNLHPKDVVQTRAFWTLWTSLLLNAQATVFISTSYKTYGQSFISDDKFLALVGSLCSVFNASGRIFWGHLADMYSYKVVTTSLCCFMAALMLTYIVTNRTDRIMFVIWTCAIFFTFSGNYALFPTATARTFGMDYVGLNYGLVFTSQSFAGPVNVFLLSALHDIIGWFGMFAMVAGLSLLSAVITLTFNVKTLSGTSV